MEMNHVNFVYWNKIYSIFENDGIILIYAKNGDLILQTTPQKLSEDTSQFGKMANRIYTFCILQNCKI